MSILGQIVCMFRFASYQKLWLIRAEPYIHIGLVFVIAAAFRHNGYEFMPLLFGLEFNFLCILQVVYLPFLFYCSSIVSDHIEQVTQNAIRSLTTMELWEQINVGDMYINMPHANITLILYPEWFDYPGGDVDVPENLNINLDN